MIGALRVKLHVYEPAHEIVILFEKYLAQARAFTVHILSMGVDKDSISNLASTLAPYGCLTL